MGIGKNPSIPGICAVLIVSALLLASPRALADNAGAAPAATTPRASTALRIINKNQFCERLQQVFSNFGAANGYDRVQTAMLANGATVAVVQEFRAGRATDYMNAGALAALANVPSRGPQDAYLPLAGFVGQAMGIGENVTLALSAAELRFIAFAPKGLDIIVIAQNAASITPERAHKVAEMANNMSIHINIVWVGAGEDSAPAVDEARSLAWLAAVTGGAFANLSGSANPCANSL